jgi:hypothetical protein
MDSLPAGLVPPDAEDEPRVWHSSLSDEFGWKIAPDFTLKELETIYQAGLKILSYVNDITGDRGLLWMNKYLGGINFVHGEFPGTHNSFVTGTTVRVTPGWQGEYWTHIVHELGHVYDDNTVHRLSRASLAGRIPKLGVVINRLFWAAIWGGGNADRLQKAIGGRPSGVRFLNGTRGVPKAYRWPEGGYGNVATAEYFAEAFMYMVYDPVQVPGPPGVVVDILQGFIKAEASNLS